MNTICEKQISQKQFMIIDELQEDLVEKKKEVLAYALKNGSQVNLYFSYVAQKDKKLFTGNIVLEQLLRLQNNPDWKFMELHILALTDKNFSEQELRRELRISKDHKIKKQGVFKGLNRLREAPLLVKQNKFKTKKSKGLVEKSEPQLPRITSNKNGTKLYSQNGNKKAQISSDFKQRNKKLNLNSDGSDNELENDSKLTKLRSLDHSQKNASLNLTDDEQQFSKLLAAKRMKKSSSVDKVEVNDKSKKQNLKGMKGQRKQQNSQIQKQSNLLMNFLKKK